MMSVRCPVDCVDMPNLRLSVAVGIRGGVAALEPNLMHPAITEMLCTVQEELLVEVHAAGLVDVGHCHPAADPVGVELVVEGPVERVREVDPSSVAADLHHLW